MIDRYIISTESNKIIEVVKKLGYNIEYKRPIELAGDNISRIDAIKMLFFLNKKDNINYDIIVDLGVASPFKSVNDLNEIIKLCIDNNVENVFSVCPSTKIHILIWLKLLKIRS